MLKFIKKLVLAWDPDYTKVTPAEKNVRRNGKGYCRERWERLQLVRHKRKLQKNGKNATMIV